MKRYFAITFVLMLMACIAPISGSALAREDVYQRIENQQHRINEGIESGALTKAEAETLEDNLNHIRHTFYWMKAGGHVTHKEEKRLHRMLDENDKMIYKKKHNLKVRRLY